MIFKIYYNRDRHESVIEFSSHKIRAKKITIHVPTHVKIREEPHQWPSAWIEGECNYITTKDGDVHIK